MKGRPKGSRSVIGVSLEHLNRIFQPDTIIPVEIKFAKAIFSQNKTDLIEFKMENEEKEGHVPVVVTEL